MINPSDANKFISRGFKGFMVVWGLCFTLGLAMVGGLIYVGIHFVSKYW